MFLTEARFRRARTRSDIEFVRAAQAQTAALSYGRRLVANEGNALFARTESALQDPNSCLMVAESAAQPVGYCWVEIRPGKVAYVLDLYVHPRMRRQGLGHGLLKRVFRLARILGMREVRLTVSAKNRVARAFYQAAGFESVAEEVSGRGIWFELLRPTALSQE